MNTIAQPQNPVAQRQVPHAPKKQEKGRVIGHANLSRRKLSFSAEALAQVNIDIEAPVEAMDVD
jgi:hypothetical protein